MYTAKKPKQVNDQPITFVTEGFIAGLFCLQPDVILTWQLIIFSVFAPTHDIGARHILVAD